MISYIKLLWKCHINKLHYKLNTYQFQSYVMTQKMVENEIGKKQMSELKKEKNEGSKSDKVSK